MGVGIGGRGGGIDLKRVEGNVSHTVSLFFALIAWSDQQRKWIFILTSRLYSIVLNSRVARMIRKDNVTLQARCQAGR